ncbi:delta-60 repeat domain-containing protein [Prosthecobacter debontii]|uniref:Delta-60 repeat domain-containing protein n=1 Tax=Prosthecobacter debontii TaxID=48467 RepID=A0A1T4XXL4_9BACT|nr:choice-of-anchor D domain-containing protein [Prosthecobacter debontii]SKA94319.1 delta-60 repeat domain-containing protein [Prosthecobacter debontii]
MTAKALTYNWLLISFLILISPSLHAAPGDTDTSYQIDFDLIDSWIPVEGATISALTHLPNGQIIAAGCFNRVGRDSATLAPHGAIVKLNADGSLDNSFIDQEVVGIDPQLLVQSDGGVILIGDNVLAPKSHIIRFNTAGDIDENYPQSPNNEFANVYSAVIQNDDKVILNGLVWNDVENVYTGVLIRLNVDGTIDTSFNPELPEGFKSARLLLQSDGKIIVEALGPMPYTSSDQPDFYIRLNTNGQLDSTFPSNFPRNILLFQGDGKIVSYSATENRIVRHNADASLDTTFNSPSIVWEESPLNDYSLRWDGIHAATQQADGKILIASPFSGFSGGVNIRNLARLNTDGSIDTSFVASNPLDNSLKDCPLSMQLQADGKLLVGGYLTNHRGLARLHNSPATESMYVDAGNNLYWMRSGSAPEVSEVSFERSLDAGVTWTLLGEATRISGGWKYSDISLPGGSLIRARAKTLPSVMNRRYWSHGYIEATKTLYKTTPEIAISSNNIPISNGDLTPSETDGTQFEPVLVPGASSTHTFTMTNDSDALLEITSISTSNSLFQISGPASLTVPARGSQTFDLSYLSAFGPIDSTIEVHSNAVNTPTFSFSVSGRGKQQVLWAKFNDQPIPNISDAPAPSIANGTDFGTLVTGDSPETHSFVLETIHPVPRAISSITVSGPHANDFTISGLTAPLTIPGNETRAFGITFTPTGYGPREAVITIHSDDEVMPSYSFPISGKYLHPNPEIVILGKGLEIQNGDSSPSVDDGTDFGKKLIGGKYDQPFTIENHSDSILIIHSVSYGANDGHIKIAPPLSLPISIQPRDSYPFTVRFETDNGGFQSQVISFHSNDADTPTHSFTISGTSIYRMLNVVGNGLLIPPNDTTPRAADETDFGTLFHSHPAVVRSFSLQTSGTRTVSSITLSSSQPSSFSLGGDLTLPVQIESGQPQNFSVIFNPGIETQPGMQEATVTVTSDDEVTPSYSFKIQGQYNVATYTTSTDLPVTGNSVSLAGSAPQFVLDFAPETGTNLTLINNTGKSFITGEYDDLAHGEYAVLYHDNKPYRFVANYYGGDGNDLVLHWGGTKPYAWGENSSGRIGDNTVTNRTSPVAVDTSGALEHKTVLKVAAGGSHSLALCSDGSVVAWGENGNGQLGNNSVTDSSVPVLVNAESGSALYGRTVVDIAAGYTFSLALCSDGRVVAWGDNASRQCGDAATTATDRRLPVLVSTDSPSALYSPTAPFYKKVIRIATGSAAYHSLALCEDGTLVAWGRNTAKCLGNNSASTYHNAPVLVNKTSGALLGKQVIGIATGADFCLALCDDQTIAAWGQNASGRLGNGTTTDAAIPVLTSIAPLLTHGSNPNWTIHKLITGASHCLLIRSDGSAISWGDNIYYGKLGINNATDSFLPVFVNTDSAVLSALAGKTVVDISAGEHHSYALCSDGTMTAWGHNNVGQLAIGSTSPASKKVPTEVVQGSLTTDQRFVSISSGFDHALALVADKFPADWDEDGILDSWEFAHLPAGSTLDDLFTFLPGDDADLDGVSNLQEFLENTDPRDALSYLEPVVWTSFRGTQADGVNGGLKKTAATGTANADAVGSKKLIGDGRVVFKANASTTVAVGFNLENLDATRPDLDYCISIASGSAQVYENGTAITAGNMGVYTPDTLFTIERQGNQIRYYKDQVLFYTSEVTCSGILTLDAYLQTINQVIPSVRFTGGDMDNDAMADAWEKTYLPASAGFAELQAFLPTGDKDGDKVTNLQEFLDHTDAANSQDMLKGIAWEDHFNTSGFIGSLEKISGGAAAYDADAISQKSFTDIRLSFRASPVGTLAIGLNDANNSRLLTDLNFAIVLTNGSAQIYQNGTSVGASGALGKFGSNTLFTIKRTGSSVTYWKDGELRYTSSLTASGLYIVDTAFNTIQAQILDARYDKNDADGDGMFDDWERYYGLDPEVADAAMDADGDGLTNIQEYFLGLNPQSDDTDNDLLPDKWELDHGLNAASSPEERDTFLDPDQDGLDNLAEYRNQTDPMDADSDNDMMPDGWEITYGFDPTYAPDASWDADGDGIINRHEFAYGTNPRKSDSDNDGIPDYWELTHFLDPKSYTDGLEDPDGDSIPNYLEYVNGTDLWVSTPQGPSTSAAGPVQPNKPNDPPPQQGRILAFTKVKNSKAYVDAGRIYSPPDEPLPHGPTNVVYLTEVTEDVSSGFNDSSTESIQPYVGEYTSGAKTEKNAYSYGYMRLDTTSHRVTNAIVVIPPNPSDTPILSDLKFTEKVVTHSSWRREYSDVYDYFKKDGGPSYSSTTTSTRNDTSNKWVNDRIVAERSGPGLPSWYGPLPMNGTRKTVSFFNPQQRTLHYGYVTDAYGNVSYYYDEGPNPHPASTSENTTVSISSVNEYSLGIWLTPETQTTTTFTSHRLSGDFMKGDKKVGTWSRSWRLSDPISWGHVDMRMRKHLKEQNYPSTWTQTQNSTQIGTAEYKRDYRHGIFSSEANSISWYLQYEIPEGLSPEEKAELPPISRSIFLTFRDEEGTIVDQKILKTILLQPGETSIIEETQAIDEKELLPHGGRIEISLMQAELYSDLNNDGQVNSSDNSFVGKPYTSDASEEEKDKGTEFIFANDSLSNGGWDKEDNDTPGKPTDTDDDDAEELHIKPGLTEGEVWLDHPAIDGLKFYKTRKCTEEIELSPSNHFMISSSNPFPNKVFVRAESVTFSTTNPQKEGDLKLMIKPTGSAATGCEAAKLKVTFIKDLGATKYFQGTRDYIFENNTKNFTHNKDYGSTRYRIVAMLEESTVMFGLDTYDHVADQPRLKGIDAVKASYNCDVIINGNQCFNSGVTLPGGMTDRCDGRLCVGRLILRPPSDDTHHPDLGGALGRYICHTLSPQTFTFGAGQIPDPPNMDQGIGGLSTNYTLGIRQSAENQAVGRGKGHEAGKGIIFTATNYEGKGGAAAQFATDAHNSGVQSLTGGNPTNWELLFLDGSTSVGLVLSNPDGDQQTIIKGAKHKGFPYYYVNTYLLFECDKPRN